MLLDHKLIEVVGRKDAVGKPFLFGTTDEFLKRFNLNSLEDLPAYEDLLERIKVIRQETEVQQSTDSLYRDHTISQEEIIPEFLQGENFETIEADSSFETIDILNESV